MRLQEEIHAATGVAVVNAAAVRVNPALLVPKIETPDYGTVTLSKPLYDRWNTDAKKTVGWPISDSFALAGGGSAVYCEAGMIVAPPKSGPFVVQGRIYIEYRSLNDVHGWVGLPLGDQQPAANGGQVSRFANADIYYSSASGAHEVHGAIRDRFNAVGGVGSFLGYPLTDETQVMNGASEVGRFNRFQGGVIYWSGATGAWEVHGAIRDEWENGHKGALGEFGFPTSNETSSPNGSYRYSNFQHGVILCHMADGAISAFTKMDFFLDGFNSKGSDGAFRGGQDIYVKVTIDASSGEKYHARMPSDGDYGADEVIQKVLFTIGTMQGGTSIHVRMEGWDSDWPDGDDKLGTVDKTYTIDNLWGINEDASHWVGDFQARYKVRPIVNFDHSKFRENYYWKFHNYSTSELSWGQFAETFRDVSNDETVIWHPFDHLFYSTVYKGVASTGNCFGMCWESIFAQVGRSIYREPIGIVPPVNGKNPVLPTNSEVMNVVNVKHGYQVSGEMVDWILPHFITGGTHDPVRAFRESRAQFAQGDYPVLALTDKSLSLSGHVIRPYAWDDSVKPWKMYVCDPNQPLVSGADPRNTYVEVDPDRNTFSFRHANNDIWTGSSSSGGRMYSIPFHVVCSQPRTPFWEALALLLGASLILLGGDAQTQQIRDANGKTFYKNGLANGPQNWDDLQVDASRIANMTRVPLLHGVNANLATAASKLNIHLGDLIQLARNPELYFMTQQHARPGDLVISGNLANHLGDLAVANVAAANTKPGLSGPSASMNANTATTMQIGLLHSLLDSDPVPAGGLEVKLAQGGGAYTWGVRTPVASHVIEVPNGAAAKDSLLVENLGRLKQALTYSPENEKTVGISVAGSTTFETPRAFGIKNLMLRSGQKVRTHFDESTGALVVENPGEATKLDVHISAGTGAAMNTTRTAVPIEANSITRFEPDTWTPAGMSATKIKMAKLAPQTGAPLSTVEI